MLSALTSTKCQNEMQRCTMQPNKSVNTDAQGRPLLRRSSSLGAGYVQR
jgi:hypothetical protein